MQSNTSTKRDTVRICVTMGRGTLARLTRIALARSSKDRLVSKSEVVRELIEGTKV